VSSHRGLHRRNLLEDVKELAATVVLFLCQRSCVAEHFLPYSNRPGTFSRDQHLQQSGSVANASCDGHECFCHERMLLRQCLKTLTDVLELIGFVQNRLKRHGYTALSLKKSKVGELQMDWLRSEDLKEVKVITTSVVTLTWLKVIGLPQIEL
jgi:hypothetical protein